MKALMRALVALGALGVTLSTAPVKQSTAPEKQSKVVKLSKSEMASITAGAQPSSGQPGATEGQQGGGGPPPGQTGSNTNNPH
jgi:hypothetical protein